jgi:hypothetical protein
MAIAGVAAAVVCVGACAVAGSSSGPVAGPVAVPRSRPGVVLDAAQSVQATKASDLLNMVGINIHSDDGASPYGNYPETEKLLAQLGVHHVRDDMAYSPIFVRSGQYNFYNTLRGQGIGVDLVLSKGADPSDMAGRLASVATYFPTAVDAIEGPNELNLAPGDQNWAAQDASYEQLLFAGVKANPVLRTVPVVAPSLANYLAIRNNDEGFISLGNLTASIDDGNVHLYPGGRDPTWDMDTTFSGVQYVSGTKPVWVTEAGYHDAVTTAGRDTATPDSVIADYLPRLLLEYHLRHAARVNIYELYDEASDPGLSNFHDHFGLVSLQGRLKPQFKALRNFDQLLTDGTQPFVAGSLAYTVTSGSTPVTSTLVEKSNGEFVLFLWRDVSLFDIATQRTTPVPAVPVTVTLGAPASKITEYRPSLAAKVQLTVAGSASVTVPVAGDAVALVIKP